jgi:hypothetical protein
MTYLIGLSLVLVLGTIVGVWATREERREHAPK